MQKLKIIYIVSFFLASFSAHALGPVFELGVHAGGDEITTASTTSGEETVTAGGGVSAAIGLDFNISEDISAQLLFGKKEDSITAVNGNIKFSRNTVDLLFHLKLNETVYLGAGPTLHSNVKLTSDGVGVYYVQDTDFKDAVGILLDARFDIGQPDSFFLAIRGTFITYETDTATSFTYNGNSVGLIWGSTF